MFETPEPLYAENHKDLRFSPASDYHFAAAVTSAPLSASEVVEASKAFPVVFATEGPLLPLALLCRPSKGETPLSTPTARRCRSTAFAPLTATR